MRAAAPEILAANAEDVARAIDTYQKILELDPDDLQALSRLDVLYEQAQNWPELLSVLTRESEMCTDPAESVGFQYRIAELYEKRLEDVSRAIELYRDILGLKPMFDSRWSGKGINAIQNTDNLVLRACVLMAGESIQGNIGIYQLSGEKRKAPPPLQKM